MTSFVLDDVYKAFSEIASRLEAAGALADADAFRLAVKFMKIMTAENEALLGALKMCQFALSLTVRPKDLPDGGMPSVQQVFAQQIAAEASARAAIAKATGAA